MHCTVVSVGDERLSELDCPLPFALHFPPGTRAGPTKVVEALEGQHSATVVWLHGLGDSGNGISNWLNMLPSLSTAAIAPVPVSPSRALPVSPSRALPVSPSRALPVSPSRALPVSPSRALPVSPSRALPVSPSRALPVSPSRALSPRSLPAQNAVRSDVSYYSRYLPSSSSPIYAPHPPHPSLIPLIHPSWYMPFSPPPHPGYDIHAFNADAPVDAAGLDEAARYIAGILQEERRAHPDVTYIVGGISQGGRLSLYLMCRKALGSFANGSDASTLPFIASVGLSTWLPNCSLIPAPGETDAAVAERAARHPVFMAHGEVDPLIGYALGRASSDLLRNAGFSNLTFNSYPL
ncbi:unnamed protein product [Closterium sp. NIES-65]|nr:unnamed protein product [Closterium sp. NIES-65]